MDKMEEIVGLKCDQCNAEFRDSSSAQVHAKREEHSSFSEVTMFIPNLKCRLEAIKNKLEAKTILDDKKKFEEERKKEIARRASGKADLEVKRQYKEKQITEAAEKMRNERNEDKNALYELRKKVKEEKEERKKARIVLLEENDVHHEHLIIDDEPQVFLHQIRIQVKNVKLSSKISETFKVDSKLHQIIEWMEKNEFIINSTSSLYLLYPQRIDIDIFSQESKEKSLKDLSILKSSTLLFEQ